MKPTKLLPPKPVKERVDHAKIDRFIQRLNTSIKKKEYDLNTSLDRGVERLNQKEFELVRAKAEKLGWEFKMYDDNYQTISYSLRPLKEEK